jgi:hypothetical protein
MLGSGRGLMKRLFWHLLACSAESHKRSREFYLLACHIVYSGKKKKKKGRISTGWNGQNY